LRLIQTDNPEEHTELKAEHIEALGIDLKIAHDKKCDSHYDLASALIKSLRASHPDASVYYLARLRRLLIFASEDVGNANPTALTLATSAMQAVHMLGMPEARITLSQLTTYLACSPKSNKSYEAINKAIRLVKKTGSLNIPKHLKNAPTDFMKSEGNSIGYIYPHDDQNYRSLTYFPDELPKTTLYSPGKVGVEAKFTNVLSNIRPVKD
jgi:putative ATPase